VKASVDARAFFLGPLFFSFFSFFVLSSWRNRKSSRQGCAPSSAAVMKSSFLLLPFSPLAGMERDEMRMMRPSTPQQKKNIRHTTPPSFSLRENISVRLRISTPRRGRVSTSPLPSPLPPLYFHVLYLGEVGERIFPAPGTDVVYGSWFFPFPFSCAETTKVGVRDVFFSLQ